MSMNYNSYIYGRWIKWGIAALVIIILAVSSISTYNGLTAADQQVQMQWSTVESMMQRRADVISNQVEVVKGYMQHEEKIFGEIAAARAVLLITIRISKVRSQQMNNYLPQAKEYWRWSKITLNLKQMPCSKICRSRSKVRKTGFQ